MSRLNARCQNLFGFLATSEPVFLGEFNSGRYSGADRLWLTALLATIGMATGPGGRWRPMRLSRTGC
jgi:hypothetical protein